MKVELGVRTVKKNLTDRITGGINIFVDTLDNLIRNAFLTKIGIIIVLRIELNVRSISASLVLKLRNKQGSLPFY